MNGSIVLPSWATVTLTLELDPQPPPGGAGPGADARQSEVSSPASATFRLSPGAAAVQAADATVAVFGWSASLGPFESPPLFDSETQRIEIPFDAADTAFEVHESRAAPYTVSGGASVMHAGWSLPVTVGANLGVAAGAGGIAVHVGPGIDVAWPPARHHSHSARRRSSSIRAWSSCSRPQRVRPWRGQKD